MSSPRPASTLPRPFPRPCRQRLAFGACLALLGASACEDPAPAPPPCEPSVAGTRTSWRDAQGRVVIYRGVNAASAAKEAPDHLPPIDAADYERIAAWGMNSVRFLLFWEAVEPSPGVYDTAYLDGVRGHLELARAAGLDVLLDLHQDVYGSGFGFAGFPPWSCDASLYASFTRPSAWFLSYFTPEVTECFDRFWASAELRAAYAQAAATVAAHLGSVPGVLGLEIMNEPFWGSAASERFEPQTLQPFYDEVARAVAAVAPALPIVAEPSEAHAIGMGTFLTAPFGCPTWMFAPHYYPLASQTGYDGDPSMFQAAVATLQGEADALGAPLGITEAGVMGEVAKADAYLTDLLAALDPLPASLWLWDYGPADQGFSLVDATHTLRPYAAGILRPSASRIAGALLAQSWDPSSRTYQLTWQSDGNPAPTEVSLPDTLVQSGFDVSLVPALPYDASGRRLSVVAPAGEVHLVLQGR